MNETPPQLEGVRKRLQELGYLKRGVDRMLLREALVPGALPVRVVRVAILGGGLLGLLLTPPGAVLLSWLNRPIRSPLKDLLVWSLALFPLLGAAMLLAVGIAAGLVAIGLKTLPRASYDALRWGVAGAVVAATALGLGAFLRGPVVDLPPMVRVLAIGIAAAILALAWRWLASALLAVEVWLVRWTPEHPPAMARWWRNVALVGIGFAALSALVPGESGQKLPPSSWSRAPAPSLLLLAVDGVLREELEYLLARGELPAVEGTLKRDAARIFTYERGSDPPATLFTTLVTARLPQDHGVMALETYRVRGSQTPLFRLGPLRPWLQTLAWAGFAEHRALLANERRVPALWELVARGGEPVELLGWWGTYPAPELPGRAIAHGFVPLLERGAQGVAFPQQEAEELHLELESISQELGTWTELAGVSPELVRETLGADLLLLKRFEKSATAASTPRLVAAYLSGLDVLAPRMGAHTLAWGDLVRKQLGRVDAVLRSVLASQHTVVVVFDPGRRGGNEGGLLWQSPGCSPKALEQPLDPVHIGSALFRMAGLPQSLEIPEPPAFCSWPAPPERIRSFGLPRGRSRREGGPGAEYLQTLRSLGYL